MPQAIQIHQAYKPYLAYVKSCPALTLHPVSEYQHQKRTISP